MQNAWDIIETASLGDEQSLLRGLIAQAGLNHHARARITARGADLVRAIRKDASPALMEVFLAEYGLSTREGIALMCLAEALLRVPDALTMDALIEDKIAPSDWGRHLGQSASSLVNASTWALMLTGRVLEDDGRGLASHLKGAVKRLGEPVIRAAVARAMKEMGRAFVLGETIEAALERGAQSTGYTHSFDMLGEAARTEGDARRYHLAYSAAITAIAARAKSPDIRDNPGISVKLSALHPRYEVAQEARVMRELVPRLAALAGLARAAGIGLNVDAEEADRLALSLKVIGAVMADPALAGWDGFGVVVQAYARRAGAVIDWLYAQADLHDRRIMLRLVKGAYWDSEIKRAQVLGLPSFPVWTRKEATDAAYLAQARKLLGMTDRIYPQFATHNAHTVAAILDMADGTNNFEFQRLHGMGAQLHAIVKAQTGARCRIYAPVGAHRDLLAYLVRRLLENGANSSFVNQIVNTAIAPEDVAACPLTALEAADCTPNPRLPTGAGLFAPRQNARGWDIADAGDLAAITAARAPFETAMFHGAPISAEKPVGCEVAVILNPATGAQVGTATLANAADIETALASAAPWDAAPAKRAKVLNSAADLLEQNHGQIFALLAREAGKTLADAISELREAVDFLRYYAEQADQPNPAIGVFAAISPWNFPLAIFTGQIAGALAAGNGVIAKPAEETPLIAALAVQMLHLAGVPRSALHLLIGDGRVGAALTSDARIGGVVFTGSTETAHSIRSQMAQHLAPCAPLIAETGGLNAMVIDSTALPEQAVRDILASAFQSAGQRCSALRCVYVQADIAPQLTAMLKAAMDELVLGDPMDLATDIGPVISQSAQCDIAQYIADCARQGRLLHQLRAPESDGHFIAPSLICVASIADLPREIFGPVLHIASFAAADLPRVLADINARGYGLTFGLHSRIDARVQQVVDAVHCGNIYINRNQIGAVVGCQPFGGEGFSGTGPKAGGRDYVPRFTRAAGPNLRAAPAMQPMNLPALKAAILGAASAGMQVSSLQMAGPTGESNCTVALPRAPILCLGPSAQAADAQCAAITHHGGAAIAAGPIASETLEQLQGFSGVIWWGDKVAARAYAQAMARRKGPILPLIGGMPDGAHALHHRHICVDTTASGGNAQLLQDIGG
jgi:RHH-type proline utilization regulon transcriptional repressor/proline dehydrogenase/delta 1-pyrroline-5-carboxylate dehydrogenase